MISRCIREGCLNTFTHPDEVIQLYCCRKCRKLDKEDKKHKNNNEKENKDEHEH